MGKYMRKAKATGELAVMEVSQSSLGVRTRAKTLALKGLQKGPSPAAGSSGGSYLQLRSRRLELRPPVVAISAGQEARKQRQQAAKLGCARKPGPTPGLAAAGSGSAERGEKSEAAKEMAPAAAEAETTTAAAAAAKEGGEEEGKGNGVNGGFVGEEASFGENVLEFEGRERDNRESTPCNLIRNPDAIRTPGSTTRPTSSAEPNRRTQNSSHRHIPTAHEMDEFFAGAEVEQQQQFIDKYNFDPVNDKPLPGRYKWEKVDS